MWFGISIAANILLVVLVCYLSVQGGKFMERALRLRRKNALLRAVLDVGSDRAMQLVDRDVALLKPKQPYIDWINSLPGAETQLTAKDLTKDCSAYLIRKCDSWEEAERVIRGKYVSILDSEMERATGNVKLWPESRTYKLFQQWFELEWHSVVIDTRSGVVFKGVMQEGQAAEPVDM